MSSSSRTISADPTLPRIVERARPDFGGIATGEHKKVFEAAYELTRGGISKPYKTRPWLAVAHNDNDFIRRSVAAISCMHRKAVVNGEQLHLVPWHAVLRLYYDGLKAAIEKAQGSDKSHYKSWEWKFSEFLEAGSLSREEFYQKYPARRPPSILQQVALDHKGMDGMQNVANLEQFCWAWRNSGNGARNKDGSEYDEWDLRRDIAKNGRGWLVDAARRIYAEGFLASGDHAAAQLQVRDAYRCLERWVRSNCERDLLFSWEEFGMAAVCPSDAEFHLSYPHTFSPSNDECRAIPVESRRE